MSSEHSGYGVSAQTFQEIIRERKAEKIGRAKEKLVEIVNSIRDRKSKSGVDPLDQFPKEIWEMVLDGLDHPKDLGNVSQVHGVFHDLLESRKLRDILLPQLVAFPIQTRLNPSPHEETLPLARDVKMRAVSKSMRSGIDHWYEDNLIHYLRSGKNLHKDDFDMPTIWIGLTNVAKRLLENYVGSGSDESKAINFFRRSIGYFLSANFPEDIVRDEEKQRFQEKYSQANKDISSVLQVIGDQIWHFDYGIGDIDHLKKGGITYPRMYDTLLEWLEFMPNLKWLEVNFEGGIWINPKQRKGVSIASHLDNHPFPTLEHLERLDVVLDSESVEVFEIYEAIFSANRHLRRLHIYGDHDLLERLPVARIREMDALETLCIGEEYEHGFGWQFIQPVLNFQWQLRQIQLNIDIENIGFAEVAQVLATFPTLEQVSVKIMKVRITGELKFLVLPNLTEFELKFNPLIDFDSPSTVQFFFSLQFLLYCKKLRKLQWHNMNGMREDRKLRRFMTNRECHERMINFRGGYRNLNHSNVWDVFPYLEIIEVYLVESNRRRFISCRTMQLKRIERDLPNDKYSRNRP